MLDTELTIADLAETIHNMCPIKIIIDDLEVWSDDVDLTDIPEGEEREILTANYAQYNHTLRRSDLVSILSFEITDYHHSIVRITTAKEVQ